MNTLNPSHAILKAAVLIAYVTFIYLETQRLIGVPALNQGDKTRRLLPLTGITSLEYILAE